MNPSLLLGKAISINKPKTNDQNLAQNNNIVRVKPDEETKD